MSSQAEIRSVLSAPTVKLGEPTDPMRKDVESDHLSRAEVVESPIATFSTLTTRGGVYLGVRYALGVLISIGNMFVLTWWIGPHAYGIFVTAVGLTAFLGSLTRSGVDTYLVRRAAPPTDDMFHIASTLIFVFSMALTALGLSSIPLLARWYGNREFVPAYATMLLTVPLVGLAGPPTAKLERAMNFRAVAQIELGSQLLALAVSLTLAWCGMGVWAPVFGHLTWQCAGMLAAYWTARFIPRPRFDAACAREMLSFGVGYTASLRTWQLRTLVNPLLVARFAGSEGVAFVGLAIRIAEGLGFIRIAAARLAIATLARLQENRQRFSATLERALEIQVLVLGPLLCGFAVLGPLLVQKLMGHRWMPSLQVYPFIATGVLVNSVFNLQASALFVVGEQWVVLKSYASHVTVLALGTSLLIPRFGLAGYGLADLSACVAYVFLQAGLSRVVGISHRRLLAWVVAFTAPLFVNSVNRGWALALCLPVLLMSGAATWKWSRASRVKASAMKSEPAKMAIPVLQRLYTFLLKTRYRGFPYAFAILRYVLHSRNYRLRVAFYHAIRGRKIFGRTFGLRAKEISPCAHAFAKFHFSANDISGIVDSIPHHLKQQVVVEAEMVVQQHFCFRGEERSFDDEVDWALRPRGNTSWNWDLNRHRFFVTLGAAYYYTGRTQYLTKLLDLWEHWINKNPAMNVSAWKHPFEVAARLQNWIWAYFMVEFSGQCDHERLARLLRAMHEHARFVHSNLEYHWPNNHLLLEAKALFEYALLFPQFRNCRKFLARARRILQREVIFQLLADGAHSELCSMYHRIIAGELDELEILCQKNGLALSAEAQRRIASSLEFTRALVRDDGSAPLLGDSAQHDEYIRFDPIRRQYSDLNYWLWREDECVSQRPPEVDWPPRLGIFPQAGYAFLHAGSAARELHLTFDFGRFSRCPSPNHGHCDALGFELYAAGQPILVDPGVYLPWNDDEGWARHFRSTAAHNTLMIDGKEQSELCQYADVRQVAKTRLTSHYVSSGGAAISADCIPHWAVKDGIVHRREIRHETGGILTVHDEVQGSGLHQLEWNFQFAPELDVMEQGDGNLAIRSEAGTHLLTLHPVTNRSLSLTLSRGQTRPLRGWVSRNSAQVLPAYAALYTAEVELPFTITFRLNLPF